MRSSQLLKHKPQTLRQLKIGRWQDQWIKLYGLTWDGIAWTRAKYHAWRGHDSSSSATYTPLGEAEDRRTDVAALVAKAKADAGKSESKEAGGTTSATATAAPTVSGVDKSDNVGSDSDSDELVE